MKHRLIAIGLLDASSAMKTIAISLSKINNDLRWMNSGPNAGLNEIELPAFLQAGSSIMSGKVNPVVCEAALMVCAQVIGNDSTVTWCANLSNFELNVGVPLMSKSCLESSMLLSNVIKIMAQKMISGIKINKSRSELFVKSSPSIITALSKIIGYENAAKIAKHSIENKVTIRNAVINMGYLERKEITQKQLDKYLDISSMV